MVLHLLLAGISVKLINDELQQIMKQPDAIQEDCISVQASARAMSIYKLNLWTVVTVVESLLYLCGSVFIGAVSTKIMYYFAFYQLFTTFMDYSFMSGFRDCNESDMLRWRIDAFLRSMVYMWVVQYAFRITMSRFVM